MLFFGEMYDHRAGLEALQDPGPDRRFELYALRSSPPKYELVCHMYQDRTVGVPEIRSTSCDAYIDELARSGWPW